jgi:hypothetical protein
VVVTDDARAVLEAKFGDLAEREDWCNGRDCVDVFEILRVDAVERKHRCHDA